MFENPNFYLTQEERKKIAADWSKRISKLAEKELQSNTVLKGLVDPQNKREEKKSSNSALDFLKSLASPKPSAEKKIDMSTFEAKLSSYLQEENRIEDLLWVISLTKTDKNGNFLNAKQTHDLSVINKELTDDDLMTVFGQFKMDLEMNMKFGKPPDRKK